MVNRIWLDSETRSKININTGIYNYAPQAEPIIITYAFDDGNVKVWQIGEKLPERLLQEIEAGKPVYAHNVMFDYSILKNLLNLSFEQMRDTMAIATANHLPAGLAEMCQVLGVTEGKLDSGKRLITKFCTPNKSGGYNKPEDFPDHWAEFIAYAIRDVEAMRSATKLCHDLSEEELEVWRFTQRVNSTGVPVNLESAKHFKLLSEFVKKELNSELMQLTNIPSASMTARLKNWLNDQGAQVEGVAKDDIAHAKTQTSDTKVLRVLDIRQQASMTSPKKFDVFLRSCHEGRFKGAYMYHGANSGRFASRGGLNLQNMPRGSEKDAVGAYQHIKELSADDYTMLYGASIEPLSSVIRPTIEAPQGKSFINFDYSSIENRVAPWVGGELAHLELFRQGLDEYVDFATDINGVAYEDVTKEMRQIAKSAVLGSVFGAGAKGLQKYYEGFGIEIELDRTQELVSIYRAKHKGVVKAWRNFGKAILKATNNMGETFKTNRCSIKSSGRFLRLKLPSGRVIQWAHPEVEEKRMPWGDMGQVVTVVMNDSYTSKWKRQALIGSSVFQSVVQASARDILVESMMKIEKAGYNIVLTTHDELMCEVSERHNLKAMSDEIERLMTTNPTWCPEIPLAVEGWVGKNYRK